MKTVRLDTPISILARTTTKEGRYHTRKSTWAVAANVLAEVQDSLPSRADRVADGISLTRRPARVRIHWRDDVGQENRIRIGPPPADPEADNRREMRVVAGPAEYGGRRRYLELMVEEISTEGEEP